MMCRCKDGVSFKVVHDVRIEDMLQDLGANRQKGYWTIVVCCTLVSFPKNGDNVGHSQVLWYTSTVKRYFEGKKSKLLI